MSTNELHNIFGKERLDDRQVTELVGVCRGLIADGLVNEREAEFLQKWLAANAGVTGNVVVCNLLRQITSLLEGRAAHHDEAKELFDTLEKFTGNDIELGETLKSCSLPFDEPPPRLSFKEMKYCFTGTFVFGPRNDCEAAVQRLGATSGTLTLKTNFLIVGAYATESWAQSSYGRKIERAVEMKENGHKIAIVGEQHWRNCLGQ
jgi:NAD-dependent DNA ligase